MVYHVKVIRKRAERVERKRMQNYKVHAERLSAFEELLNEIYTVCRPKPSDYEVRRDLVSVFNLIAKDIYGRSGDVPVVVEFGSFVMDLFHSKSDLDLSVNFNNSPVEFPHEKRIQTLKKFAKKLYALQRRGHVSGVRPITSARVPILKVVDCGTKVECDISVENRDGVSKSKIIHMICSLDERFQKLSFLMKAWAKAQNINSSKNQTLNSLSVVLLVAFHLQTRNPPILPPFSAILEDGSDPDAVAKSLNKFVNYGKENKESVADLLSTLLIKLLSIEKLWAKGLCASTYEASWLSKTWDSKVCCISVEDFIDRSQNVARAVGKGEVARIYKCIQRSSEYIAAFMDGLVDIPTLKYKLFGHAAPFQEGQKGSRSPIPSEPIATKRKRSTDGWEEPEEDGGPPDSFWSNGKWTTNGWEEPEEDSGPLDSFWSNGKWSTDGWEEPEEDSGPPDSFWANGKWSTDGWEEPEEDSGPPDSFWSKGEWSTDGWGKASSANWGESNRAGVPADSTQTKRKRSEETPGGTSSSAQWLRKSDTKSWPERKHDNKCAPKAKWSKMQRGGWGGS